MPKKKGPTEYWTKERVAAEARRYTTRGAFKKGSKPAYDKMCRMRWFSVCDHMVKTTSKPAGYWTRERVADEALKYQTRKDFSKGSNSAYAAMNRYGWQDVCSHMPDKTSKPTGYWTRKRVAAEARRYKTRTDFANGSKGAYLKMVREGWNDACDHMPERVPVERYWTKEKVAAVAARFDSRSAFKKAEGSVHSTASREGWLDEVCAHMERKKRRAGYWTKERLMAEAAEYETRMAFQKGSNSAYIIARNKGWLDEVCAHMRQILTPWPESAVRAEALKYTRRSDFRDGSPSAYDKSKKLGIHDDVCSHMEPVQKEWAEEEIRAIALKYKHRSDFWYHDQQAAKAARRRGILDDVCQHMTPKSGHFQNDQPCLLYYLRIETDHGPLYKIGITAQDYRRRYANVNRSRIKQLRYWKFKTGREALSVEQSILQHCSEYKYDGPDVLPQGNTELLTVDVLGIDLPKE